MALKFTAIAFAALLPIVVGCQTGNSVWSKPGYEGAPATSGASRTYTPTESISPYQQNNSSQQYNSGSGSSTR